MSSPFPGMDPFLESQEWEDFYTTFSTVLRERLGPSLEQKYLVRVERRVYLESVGSEPETMRRADVAIVTVDARPGDAGPALGSAARNVARSVKFMPGH